MNAHVRSGLYAGMLNQVRPGAKVRVLSMEEELVTVKMIEHARDGFTDADESAAALTVTGPDQEAPTLFKSFFEDGTDGRACVDKCIAQNAENPFTITCSATETFTVHHNNAH